MPDYRSRLFESDDRIDLPVPDIVAKGWSAKLQGLTLSGSYEYVTTTAREARYSTIIESLDFSDTAVTNRYAPEIIISAPSREDAQLAQNLISAGAAVLLEIPVFEELAVVPCNLQNPEGLREDEVKMASGSMFATDGLWKATAIAAKATQRTMWKYAITKYLASVKACSVHPMDHSPYRGVRFRPEKDPVEINRMCQAITLAFAVIEELGLDVRASREAPSTLSGGAWNPPVLEKFQSRLRKAGIRLAVPVDWIIRGMPGRIERKKKPPAGEKTPWTKGLVRDREVPIVDAINYASFLRSKVAAHKAGKLTSGLTMVDVSNVQHLSQRLLLEILGLSPGR